MARELTTRTKATKGKQEIEESNGKPAPLTLDEQLALHRKAERSIELMRLQDEVKQADNALRTRMARKGSIPYDAAVGREILQRLETGETLIGILDDPDPRLPGTGTFYRWLESDAGVADGFRERYAQARETHYRVMGEQIIALADRTRLGAKIKTEGGEVEVVTQDMVDRAKLQIETRKWVLARLLPKVYGDRLDVSGSVNLTYEQRLQSLAQAQVVRHAALPMVERLDSPHMPPMPAFDPTQVVDAQGESDAG
jgi:hypothetical protein